MLDYNEAILRELQQIVEKIMKYRRLWKKLCRGSKFEVLLKLVLGCVEGLYCVEGSYCGKYKVSICVEEERCVEA